VSSLAFAQLRRSRNRCEVFRTLRAEALRNAGYSITPVFWAECMRHNAFMSNVAAKRFLKRSQPHVTGLAYTFRSIYLV
jgi:hypothetical protein